MNTLWRVAALAAVLALAGGCALGPQSQPVALTRSAGQNQSPSPGNGALTIKVSERVYLVHNGTLVQVRRTAPLRDSHLQTVVGALFEPLGFLERNEGLRTALPSMKTPVRVRVHNHTATVALPPGFDRLAVSEQILAVGQIVFSISANSAAFRVQFTADRKRVPVPDGSGRLLDRPVTRADYVRIAP